MNDFLQELRDRWDDPYFWADHQALRMAGIAVVAGIIGLIFHYAELRLDRAMRLEGLN